MTAVRRPLSIEPSTQPVVPSASRTCRQLSNSLITSTGRPARRNTQAVGYSVPGPWRRLTRSDFKLTKRGTGSPVAPAAGAGVPCADRRRRPPATASSERQRARDSAPARRSERSGFAERLAHAVPKPRFGDADQARSEPRRCAGAHAQAQGTPATDGQR